MKKLNELNGIEEVITQDDLKEYVSISNLRDIFMARNSFIQEMIQTELKKFKEENKIGQKRKYTRKATTKKSDESAMDDVGKQPIKQNKKITKPTAKKAIEI